MSYFNSLLYEFIALFLKTLSDGLAEKNNGVCFKIAVMIICFRVFSTGCLVIRLSL